MRKAPQIEHAYSVARDIEKDTHAMLRTAITQPWRYANKIVQLDDDLAHPTHFDQAVRTLLTAREYDTITGLQQPIAATFGEDLVQLARWRRHRIIYSIHPDTLAALMDTDWEKTPIPGEILTRLPHPDILIVLPEPIQWRNDDGHYESYDCFGVFGVRDGRRRASSADSAITHISLHFFGRVTDKNQVPIVGDYPDFTSPGTLRRAPQVIGCRSLVDVRVDETLPEREHAAVSDMFAGGPGAIVGFASISDAIEGMSLLTRTGLAILTYIASENLDISRGPREARRRNVRGSGEDREGDRASELFRVGYTIGGALREAHSGRISTGGAVRTVTPHMRRAHLHTFRRGPGHSERFTKWLPPIAIKADGTTRATRAIVHQVQ